MNDHVRVASTKTNDFVIEITFNSKIAHCQYVTSQTKENKEDTDNLLVNERRLLEEELDIFQSLLNKFAKSKI